ncbi:MAG: hypothetical protein EZS28_004862 [Streblomastix strix]|uniref:RRM domain-containing protein n=1 Tax=Streblomastix strix TaxID=222440 RepID=A0A5J4WX23_9EUKA|nr:MAG: hypothetical protein EZS28_004862 [Streblomastix strix]
MYKKVGPSDRIISQDKCASVVDASGGETKRCICISGQLRNFNDAEIWNALGKNGKLEKIVLKYDARTGYQKGFAFAVYSSEEDVERVLDGGQDVELERGHIWLERAQRNASIAIYSIRNGWTLEKLIEEACKYGRVMELDVTEMCGGRTMFIEYETRAEAENARASIPSSILCHGNTNLNAVWVDSKILNNSLQFNFERNQKLVSCQTLNEKSICEKFKCYGCVRRVDFVRDRWNNIMGEGFIYFSNTASGQLHSDS